MRLWSQGEQDSLDPAADRLNASIAFDIRLFEEDIDGSLAWIRALERAGVLSDEELKSLSEGLEDVRGSFRSGTYELQPSDEDIHTAVERLLTERVGELAKKMHTGRSRND